MDRRQCENIHVQGIMVKYLLALLYNEAEIDRLILAMDDEVDSYAL